MHLKRQRRERGRVGRNSHQGRRGGTRTRSSVCGKVFRKQSSTLVNGLFLNTMRFLEVFQREFRTYFLDSVLNVASKGGVSLQGFLIYDLTGLKMSSIYRLFFEYYLEVHGSRSCPTQLDKRLQKLFQVPIMSRTSKCLKTSSDLLKR